MTISNSTATKPSLNATLDAHASGADEAIKPTPAIGLESSSVVRPLEEPPHDLLANTPLSNFDPASSSPFDSVAPYVANPFAQDVGVPATSTDFFDLGSNLDASKDDARTDLEDLGPRGAGQSGILPDIDEKGLQEDADLGTDSFFGGSGAGSGRMGLGGGGPSDVESTGGVSPLSQVADGATDALVWVAGNASAAGGWIGASSSATAATAAAGGGAVAGTAMASGLLAAAAVGIAIGVLNDKAATAILGSTIGATIADATAPSSHGTLALRGTSANPSSDQRAVEAQLEGTDTSDDAPAIPATTTSGTTASGASGVQTPSPEYAGTDPSVAKERFDEDSQGLDLSDPQAIRMFGTSRPGVDSDELAAGTVAINPAVGVIDPTEEAARIKPTRELYDSYIALSNPNPETSGRADGETIGSNRATLVG